MALRQASIVKNLKKNEILKKHNNVIKNTSALLASTYINFSPSRSILSAFLKLCDRHEFHVEFLPISFIVNSFLSFLISDMIEIRFGEQHGINVIHV